MRHRLPIGLGRLFTALVALVVATTPAVAQNEDRPEPPRTSWGVPDLQGIWDYRTATPMERPRNYGDREFLTDEEAAAYEQQFSQRLDDNRRSPGIVADVERAYNEFWYDFGSNLTEDKRTSLIVDPPNGRIPPLTEEARLRATGPNESPLRERVIFRSGADGPEDRGLSERCILGFSSGPPLTPSAYNNMQLFQTPDHVVIFTEMVHEARIIPLDGRPHLSRGLLQWLGDSRGHWDGDTLVIETVNFTDKASFTGTLGSRRGFRRELAPDRTAHTPGRRHARLRVHGHRRDGLDTSVDCGDSPSTIRGVTLRVRLPRGQPRDGGDPQRRPGRGARSRRGRSAGIALRAHGMRRDHA